MWVWHCVNVPLPSDEQSIVSETSDIELRVELLKEKVMMKEAEVKRAQRDLKKAALRKQEQYLKQQLEVSV